MKFKDLTMCKFFQALYLGLVKGNLFPYSDKYVENVKIKDPFEKYMISVKPGFYEEKETRYYKDSYHPNGDRRRKLITVTKSYDSSTTRCVKKGFKISKYPVSHRQWKKIMGTYQVGCEIFDFYTGAYKVHCSYEEVVQFIEKINSMTGKKYRLATSLEWEWAALGAPKRGDYNNLYKSGRILCGCTNKRWLNFYRTDNNYRYGKDNPDFRIKDSMRLGIAFSNKIGLCNMLSREGEFTDRRIIKGDSTSSIFESDLSHIRKSGFRLVLDED